MKDIIIEAIQGLDVAKDSRSIRLIYFLYEVCWETRKAVQYED